MDHRYQRLSMPVMWSCGVRIAAYHLALALKLRLLEDEPENAAFDFDYDDEEEPHPGLMP